MDDPRMTIKLDKPEVALLLKGMDTVIKMAHRMKWPLREVEPYIALMHNVDEQTMGRHDE